VIAGTGRSPGSRRVWVRCGRQWYRAHRTPWSR